MAEVEMEVINPDRPPALRCNPEVRISEKVSAEALVALAQSLLEEEAQDCRFGFAAFYLPSMRPGAGAWAIAELGEHVSVSILGLSAEDENLLLVRARQDGENFGLWVDDTSYASVISLYRDGGGLKLGRLYADGGSATEPLRVVEGRGGHFELRDAAAGSGGRHYRIGTNGELESWDGVGFVSAARRVRFEADLAAIARDEAARRSRRASVHSAGRSLARAAAAQERWRKFSEWLELYRESLAPARHALLELGTPRSALERDAACSRLAAALEELPADRVRAAPSRRIEVDPLLAALGRLGAACAMEREIQVLLEAAGASSAWQKVDRAVEQVVSELRPEEDS